LQVGAGPSRAVVAHRGMAGHTRQWGKRMSTVALGHHPLGVIHQQIHSIHHEQLAPPISNGSRGMGVLHISQSSVLRTGKTLPFIRKVIQRW
jgi:hypothetical protein